MVSAQSKMSALLFSTDRALLVTFEEILASTVTLAAGMPGMFIFAHSGFGTAVNDAFGTMSLTMYGPTPGGGVFGSLVIGVPQGVNASDGNASTFMNGP